MIQSREDYLEYLCEDKKELARTSNRPGFFDLVWRFEICMRRREYMRNVRLRKKRNPLFLYLFLLDRYYSFEYRLLSILCGFSIPLNVFGKGLSIAHRGTIVVNSGARIGSNCRIHVGVNIGTVPGCSDVAPIIGDDVYIGPGAKLYGKITIGNGVMIGANSVVTHSFVDDNIIIAGVPARKINDIGRYEIEARNRTQYSLKD
ncbi:MAG: serine acetyltransferase [Muribaculaceae bacterium]|nr:serine acetyltransferase [Muribaculaceae bacterium]